jgi:hypothetical protein
VAPDAVSGRAWPPRRWVRVAPDAWNVHKVARPVESGETFGQYWASLDIPA